MTKTPKSSEMRTSLGVSEVKKNQWIYDILFYFPEDDDTNNKFSPKKLLGDKFNHFQSVTTFTTATEANLYATLILSLINDYILNIGDGVAAAKVLSLTTNKIKCSEKLKKEAAEKSLEAHNLTYKYESEFENEFDALDEEDSNFLSTKHINKKNNNLN